MLDKIFLLLSFSFIHFYHLNKQIEQQKTIIKELKDKLGRSNDWTDYMNDD